MLTTRVWETVVEVISVIRIIRYSDYNTRHDNCENKLEHNTNVLSEVNASTM